MFNYNNLKTTRALTVIALVIMVLAPWASPLWAGEVNYGGQYYPGEFLLQGNPEFWNEHDIDVEHILFSSGTENNQALISGKVDVNCGSDSKTVGLFNVMGKDAVIIATIQKGNRYATVVSKDSGHEDWRDLKGKTVATRLGSGAEQVLRRYFENRDDLAWEDFKWVNLKVENMIAALSSGNIEAFTVWEPTPAIAEAQSIGKVLRTYGDISQVPVSLHTTVEFARNNRETLVKFLAAHLAKAELIKNDPDKAAMFAAKAAGARGYDVPADAFKRVFARIDFDLDITPAVKSSIDGTAKFLFEQGKVSEVPKVYYDTSYLEEARKLYLSKGKQ